VTADYIELRSCVFETRGVIWLFMLHTKRMATSLYQHSPSLSILQCTL